LTGQRFVHGDNPGQIVERVLYRKAEAPSTIAPGIVAELDRIVLRGLERTPEKRFRTAHEMAIALEAAVTPALPSRVGIWVESIASSDLARRRELLQRAESDSDSRSMKELVEAVVTPPDARASAESESESEPESKFESTSAEVQAPRRQRRAWLVPVALVLAAAIGLGAVVLTRRPAPSTATSAAPPPASSVESSSTASESTAAPPIPSATSSASAAGSAEPPNPTSTVVRQPAAKSTKATKASCNPPWFIDKKGVKIYKMECL
jgi:serine/threonine-protein kinase